MYAWRTIQTAIIKTNHQILISFSFFCLFFFDNRPQLTAVKIKSLRKILLKTGNKWMTHCSNPRLIGMIRTKTRTLTCRYPYPYKRGMEAGNRHRRERPVAQRYFRIYYIEIHKWALLNSLLKRALLLFKSFIYPNKSAG